jgi:MoxR-like ATPase
MAKLNRVEILNAMFDKSGWDVAYEPIPSWVDCDEAIDAFGKLAKADVTEDMLYELIENGVLSYKFDDHDDWDMNVPPCYADMLNPKTIKAEYKKLHKEDKPKEKVVEKVVTKEVVVEPTPIDTDVVLGALGKAIGKSLVDDYGKLIADGAIPWIKKFVEDTYGISTKTVKFEIPDKGEVEGVFHEVFEEVLAYVSGNVPVMLVGEAGTGKNVICEQLAKVLDIPFYFANKVSDEYQLKGFMDANGNFVPTPLYYAQKNGGLFMLDEMDASNEEALEVLHSVLANKYLTYPNGEFVVNHEKFCVVAGCNTFGTGATYQYVGRRQLDAATLNRFMTVEVGYSPTIEDSLSSDTELVAFIRKFRNCCKEFGINHVVSYRNLIQLDKFVDVVGIDKVLRSGLLKNLEKDDLTMLQGRFDGDSDRWSMALKRALV